MTHHERQSIPGPDGVLEVFVDIPAEAHGLALIAHPHPLFGGTADNKVVTTLARAFREQGCITLRPSFRGVGGSSGEHDCGHKETDDLYAVLAWAKQQFAATLPPAAANAPYLAGFSFGAHVTTRLARRLSDQGHAAHWLVLVGTAIGAVAGDRHYATEPVAADTLLIHGAADELIPLATVLAWAEPQGLPVTVLPGADHFFHRKLPAIRDLIRRNWPGFPG